MPKHMDAWDDYDMIRRQELTGEIGEGETNKHYEANRAKLDEGAVHYWPRSSMTARYRRSSVRWTNT